MLAAVVIGGLGAPEAEIRRWCSESDLVVAADSGLDRLRAFSLRPDLVVGDFDSLADPSVLSEYTGRTESHPRDKDLTDTEIAMAAARTRGADRVVLLGGGGGRLDHLVAILAMFDREDAPDVWVTDNAVLERVEDEIDIAGTPGDTVSFFPAAGGPWVMESSGLKWELNGLSWTRGDTGVSNELTGVRAHVSVRSGRLLMVRALA